MAERLRLYRGATELNYSEATIELSKDEVINSGAATIEANSNVTDVSTLQFRKNDGSTAVFNAKVWDIRRPLLWDLSLYTNGYELNNIPVSQVYEGRSPEYIVQDLIDNYTTSLTYASSTSSNITIEKFIAQGYLIDVIREMILLTQWGLRIDVSDNVYFEPKGNVDNGVIFRDDGGVGTAVQFTEWGSDSTRIVNHVKLKGGLEGRQVTETISSTGTEFTLTYKPSGAITAGSDANTTDITEVDPENKTVTFGSSKTDPTFTYTYNRPVVVDEQVDDSVNTYGEIYEEIDAPYITKQTDGVKFVNEYLAVKSVPAPVVVAVREDFDFTIGVNERIRCISTSRNKDQYLVVHAIKYEAHTGRTIITLGEKEFDYFDWRVGIEDRLKKLNKKFQNDENIIFSRTIKGNINITVTAEVTWKQNSPVDSFIPANVSGGLPDAPTLCWTRSGIDKEPNCINSGTLEGTWTGTNVTTGAQYNTSGARLSCAVLNGTDTYCTVDGSPFSSDPSTAGISLDLYFDDFAADYVFLHRIFGDTVSRLWYDQSEDSLKFEYALDGVTKTISIATFSSTYSATTFYKVQIDMEATSAVTIYIDNTSVGSNTDTGTNFDSGSNDMRVGYDGTTYGKGRIDELMLFDDNAMSTSAARAAIIAKNITAPTDYRSSMTLYYAFDNCKPGDRSTSQVTI